MTVAGTPTPLTCILPTKSVPSSPTRLLFLENGDGWATACCSSTFLPTTLQKVIPPAMTPPLRPPRPHASHVMEKLMNLPSSSAARNRDRERIRGRHLEEF